MAKVGKSQAQIPLLSCKILPKQVIFGIIAPKTCANFAQQPKSAFVMSKNFTHLDAAGNPSMVDVGEKNATRRMAKARSVVVLDEAILQHFTNDDIHTKKGPVFQTAIIAGVMAAKRTGELIPLCHPLGLENCQVRINLNEQREVVIECEASLTGKTGVEMEALTGATVAALTIYDMCKAMSHNIVIKETMLMEKTGGKKDFKR
jgi:cyclic pyranopterin monophosphate synthase